jgi:hypothetical protein
MKDRKLLVRPKCTSKKVYLHRAAADEDWHMRFMLPRHIRERLGIAGRVYRSTGYREVAPAKERAAEIIDSFWRENGQGDGEAARMRTGFVTIGKLLAVYEARAKERRRTVRSNANALRLVVRSVLQGKPEEKSAAVLTEELIRKFEESRPNKRSTASCVRQARSVVSARKMKFYVGLRLPDLTGFRAAQVDAPRLSRPRPLDMNALRAMIAARPALAEKDPGVYVANLMFAHWGMRDIEIWNARIHWLSNDAGSLPNGPKIWRMHIIDRPEEDFYPKGCEGSFEVSGEVVAEILRFQSPMPDGRLLCVDDYLIPGKDKTERHKTIYRRHSKWVSTWIKDHRKTSYELRRYAGSRLLDMGATIYQVRDFLRHRNVATTENWYAYRLQNRNLPVIGMNDLAPSASAA